MKLAGIVHKGSCLVQVTTSSSRWSFFVLFIELQIIFMLFSVAFIDK